MMNAIYPKTSVPKKMVACGMVNHAKKKEAKMMNVKTLQRNGNVIKHKVASGRMKYAKKKKVDLNVKTLCSKRRVPK